MSQVTTNSRHATIVEPSNQQLCPLAATGQVNHFEWSPVLNMSATTVHPKVFVSYSWTNPEHEQFVIDLATSLRNHGVDAVLDKWDLKAGQDKYVFMESMVVDPDVVRVLVVCDRKYQEKANARAGGVGTESQIISQELYGKVKQTKFIPVVCEYDEEGQPCLPVFMKGLIYIDVSSQDRYGEGIDQLLRLIYEQPFHQKPKLGGMPEFLTNEGVSQVRELGAALRAIQDGKPNRQGLEKLFLQGVATEVVKLYVEPAGEDYHEGVYQAIAATKGLRDQLAEYVETVAAFSNDDPTTVSPFIKLMESLGSHFGPPITSGTYYPGWADLYRYFAFEAFLLQTSALIRHQAWASLRKLLGTVFIVRNHNGELKASPYTVFDEVFISIDEHRNRLLQLNRLSVSADLLKERCSPDKTSFQDVLEAEVLLMLASVSRLAADSATAGLSMWSARTTVYSSHAHNLSLFLRATDEEVRHGIWKAIGVANGKALKEQMERMAQRFNGFSSRRWDRFSDFNFFAAINLEELTK